VIPKDYLAHVFEGRRPEHSPGKHHVSVQFPVDVMERVRVFAKQEHRSVPNSIVVLVQRALDQADERQERHADGGSDGD
jgi:hypothetical protein